MPRRFALTLLLPALALAAPVPKAKDTPPPFPLTVGDTREYEYRTGDKLDETYSELVTRVEKQKDGSSHVTVSLSYPKGGSHGSYKTVISVSDTGLAMVGEGEMRLAKPNLLLKLPATVGTQWEVLRTKYEVTAEEEVEVAAGKYKASKVEMTNGTGKSTLWFAPGVGLVKMSAEATDTVLELKAFKPGK